MLFTNTVNSAERLQQIASPVDLERAIVTLKRREEAARLHGTEGTRCNSEESDNFNIFIHSYCIVCFCVRSIKVLTNFKILLVMTDFIIIIFIANGGQKYLIREILVTYIVEHREGGA